MVFFNELVNGTELKEEKTGFKSLLLHFFKIIACEKWNIIFNDFSKKKRFLSLILFRL